MYHELLRSQSRFANLLFLITILGGSWYHQIFPLFNNFSKGLLFSYCRPFSQRDSGPELFFCTLSIYDPVTIDVDSQSVRTKGVLSLVESSAFPGSIATGTKLSGLRLFRIVGQIIFLHLSSSDHLVFCRAINWDRTSKAVRAFLNNPPETGTEISRTARVLSPASSDTGRGTLHSRLPEVSFLGKFTFLVFPGKPLSWDYTPFAPLRSSCSQCSIAVLPP